MVFGFFSRKPAQPQASVEPTLAGPVDSAASNSHQLHTPSPSIDYHLLHTPTPPPVPPPDTPSPQPEQLITDPADLLSLISSVPAQTLHAYTLTHLQDTPPPALSALTLFFSALTPPPRLHCVRCHKFYFELENTDRSCLVPHDDDSAIVDRVRTGIGSGTEYESLWGCCSRTVEGSGDMGPPDGWCYEGKHTVDPKRARFRADSTPHDDKLTTCAQLRCFAPPVTAKRARSTRKRARKDVEEDDKGGEKEDDNASVGSSVSRGAISNGSNPTRAIKKPRKNTQANNPPTDPDAMDVDPPSTSVPRPNTPPTSPRRKPSTPKPKSSASSSSTRAPVHKSPLSASFTAVASPTPSRQIVSVEVPLMTTNQHTSKKVHKKEEMEESSDNEPEKGKVKEGEKVVYVTKSKASPPLTRKLSVASLKHKTSAASVKSPLKPRSSTGSLKPKSKLKSAGMQPPDVEKEKEKEKEKEGEGDKEKPALRTRASRKQLAEVVDTSVDGEGEVWMRMRTRSG